MIAVLICAIVAWLGAFEGWRKADRDQMDMVRAIGGRSWDVFTKVIVPSSLSWIITSARINIGLALIGVITGEFLASTQGLGYLVLYTAELYRMSETLAVIVLIALLAMVQLHIVNWVERKLFSWAIEPEHGMDFIS